jgi:hypothetical protein
MSTVDSDFEIYLLEESSHGATIQGTVVKTDSGEVMQGVVLETNPGNYLAGTDAEGNYTLKVLPGSYTITPLVDCYQSVSPVQVKGIQAGEVVERIISFTAGNCFPSMPSNPQPSNGAKDQHRNLILSWQGGDPDDGDRVLYDVYLGVGTEHHIEMERVSFNQKDTSYTPQGLWYDTTYYWQIVARDREGAETQGPRWSFTIMKANISGRITDAETGAPIKNCHVFLFSPENGVSEQTYSDTHGRYGFDSLAPGKYSLLLFRNGYKVEYTLIDYEGENVIRDFTLQTVQ